MSIYILIKKIQETTLKAIKNKVFVSKVCQVRREAVYRILFGLTSLLRQWDTDISDAVFIMSADLSVS